ncbi:MAG TPA: hypothetical protein VMD48_08925 [Solirubrobacteraceae bacterium]|nr:hypothetical protein [Solirubrobacteraceae bacterium]
MSQSRSTTVLRFLDVVVVLVGAIPALALGAPVFGYVMGACGWIVARAIQLNERRLTAGIADPTRAVGVRLFAAFGRTFLLAGAIIVAAVAGERKDGLTAALVIFVAYSVAFVIRLMSGPPPPIAQEPR